ncbi:MAG: TonB-dependent receptor plug domain-containing protein [Burkholderiales bacterium]|nr:TonB-dependent receptor plug domain-containing protein [Burkholderiales bacterium]
MHASTNLPSTTTLRRRPLCASVWLICAAWHGGAAAQTATPVPTAAGALDPVEIRGRHYDNAVGSSDAASQGRIRAELLASRPALRPGEVLEFVPGLIVTQHSGDGKANQYFLRGFNLDHGTDFATAVAGMPVNMPSHGHGQGYTDLNFLMPELVERISYRKGPYFATHGNFASAGAADIEYRRRFDGPFVQLSLGQNGYRRAVGGASWELDGGRSLLAAVEGMGNDGPWEVPEQLRRKNAVLSLSEGGRAQGLSLSLMAYDARWTATDQVPQAWIDAGNSRWGSLDASDGGNTSRYSLSGEWHRIGANGETRVSAYAMRYQLALYSNFTYTLERPTTGDQFSQQDRRSVYGLQASLAWSHGLAGLDARTEAGVQLRHDRARVGLFDTQARQAFHTVRDDRLRETALGMYLQSHVTLQPWLRSVLGLRADRMQFDVDSLSNAANSGKTSDFQVSPKLSLVAGPWQRSEVFLNLGRGLHSNDARGTTARVDPRSGDALKAVPGLVASQGWEIGARSEAWPGLQTSLAYWHLDFDSELVYIGDAGATEASAASRRHGVEWNNRWTPSRHVLFDADLAWTHARFVNGDHIPNAVDSVASLAMTLQDLAGWTASLQWRYLGSGALIEDNTVRSDPSSTFNLRLMRRLDGWVGRHSELTLDVFNLFNRQVNDIQYQYAYQMPGAGQSPQEGRIVHPAEPRSLRLTWRTAF